MSIRMQAFIVVITLGATSYAIAANRSCDAKYQWKTTGGSEYGTFLRFSGSGHCGATQGNQCRKKARKTLKRCITDHWADRWARKLPASCKAPNTIKDYDLSYSCRQQGAGTLCWHALDSGVASRTVSIVSEGDIKTALEVAVCCKHFNGGRTDDFQDPTDVRVNLKAYISGKTSACNHSQTLNSDPNEGYAINCSAVRQTVCSPG